MIFYFNRRGRELHCPAFIWYAFEGIGKELVDQKARRVLKQNFPDCAAIYVQFIHYYFRI